MGYLVIFIYFLFSFQKCHLRWAKNVMFTTEPYLSSVMAQVTFVFWPKMEFHFRRHFHLRPKMNNASSVGLYIKLFQITTYINDFQTLNNPSSGQPVGALKN